MYIPNWQVQSYDLGSSALDADLGSIKISLCNYFLQGFVNTIISILNM